MPGRNHLVEELGVSGKTVELALQILVDEGLLVEQGPGRPRLISLPKDSVAPKLRLEVLIYEKVNRPAYIVEIQHALTEAGHTVFFAPKSLLDLGLNVKRIGRFVEASDAMAWLVIGAPRDVLEWFAEHSVPAFALFGLRRKVSVAGSGPDHGPPMRVAIQRLVSLGHQRIVILGRWSTPPTAAQAALDEMAKHGLATGDYNMPTWDPTPEGMRRILDELFRATPPTALIIDEAFLYHAAKEYLAQRDILAPRDVSLVCVDADPTFDWCEPTVAHIRWDYRPLVRRIVRWADNVSRGREDVRQSNSKAEFIDGGTVGPARH